MQSWAEFNVCVCMNAWGTDGGGTGGRHDLQRWMNGRTCRASSPFVRPLPHHCWSSGHPPTFCAEKRETSVTAAVASCLLVLDLIRKAVFTNSLWWTFLANGFNYTAKAALVHVWEWGGGQWMERSTVKKERKKKKPTRCSTFWAYRGKPDCFFTWKLSVWQLLTGSQEFLRIREDVLGTSARIVPRYFGS